MGGVEMGDPKNGGGVEMNFGIFFGRGEAGVLSCYTKCEQTHKMGGGKIFKKMCMLWCRKCNEVRVGTENQLLEPPSRLDVTGHTFFYTTPKLWNNNVTPKQANAPSIDSFRRYFK